MPKGWFHAKKITGRSHKCSGGKTQRCLVGPKGKLFWRKCDLEKYVGQRCGDSKAAQRLRLPDTSVFQDYPKDAVLIRTKKKAREEYMSVAEN